MHLDTVTRAVVQRQTYDFRLNHFTSLFPGRRVFPHKCAKFVWKFTLCCWLFLWYLELCLRNGQAQVVKLGAFVFLQLHKQSFAVEHCFLYRCFVFVNNDCIFNFPHFLRDFFFM